MEQIKTQFSNRSFKVMWKKAGDQTEEVTVEIPDLSDSKLSVWGDWGPMCKLNLVEGLSVNLVYKKKARCLKQSCIEFLSPLCAKKRSRTPLYCSIKDPDSNHTLNLYFDSFAKLAEAEISKFGNSAECQIFEERLREKEAV